MSAQNNKPKKVSSDEALKIALRHLVAIAQQQYEGRLGIRDGVPDGLPLYMTTGSNEREHCWCISVPGGEGSLMVGRSRYICITKETGEVIFDGWAGE